MSRPIVILLVAAAGCASAPRFKDQPVVSRVGDTRAIAEPTERPFGSTEYFTDVFFRRRVERMLELRTSGPAKNTNALDELPDSSWFTNRIGARPMDPAEAALGPAADGHGPPVPPLRVVHAKEGGGNPGFIAADATGRRFLVKFDTKANPEMETATDIIVDRFFWAIGYNVPADHILVFRPEELATPAAMARAVAAAIATSPRMADGAIRATASEYLPGIPKGGWPTEGVREDDPNDRVAHEDRRELRGLRVFAAWLDHTDMKADNTLDMYVEEDGRRFLRHYLVDFGEAFAAHGAEHDRKEDGWEHAWDWELQTRAFFSFGLWRRPWEDLRPTRWASIGWFTSEGFDPKRWREAYPYFPFASMDAADAYWAAKIVMRFDRRMIEAIVAEGKLSDPEAAAYLVDTLVARRDAVGRAYLDGVSPLDELRVSGDHLCMVDLGVWHNLASGGSVERISDGTVISYPVAADGSVCVPLPPADGYTVLTLRVRRPGGRDALPEMRVHLRAGRILGLVR